MSDSMKLARFVRVRSLEMVARARASHIGSALSIADILSVLYTDILRIDPDAPGSVERDRFILSKGHACVALYAALAKKGFFPESILDTYGEDGSMLMQHASHYVPGVEFSTGSLGHGLPFGIGKSLAAKRTGRAWKVYVLMSDGEMDEGSNWEAILFAAHHKLDNLVAILDYNKLQSLTTVSETLSLEPLDKKLLAFGWRVIGTDGHDHEALSSSLITAGIGSGKPTMVICHTVKGKGVGFMEGQVKWHYKSPTTDELKRAISEIEVSNE